MTTEERDLGGLFTGPEVSMASLREHGQAGQEQWQGKAGENPVPWGQLN